MTVRKLSYQHETLKVGRSDKYIQYTHAVRQPRFLDNKVLTSSLYPLQFHSVPNGQHNRAPHTQNALALSFTTQGFLFFCFFGAPQWNLKSTMDWPQPVRLSCTISSIFWQKLTFGGWMMRVMTVFVSQHGETLPSSVWMWKKTFSQTLHSEGHTNSRNSKKSTYYFLTLRDFIRNWNQLQTRS